MPFTIFKCSLFTFSKKMKQWNLNIIGYWVIGSGYWIEKGLELSPSPPNCSKDSQNYCPGLYLPIDQVWWLNGLWFKMYHVSCTNTHHDVTDLVNHGMVKNIKTWISWEQNITFLLFLCLRRHILRSYFFVVEVTFKKFFCWTLMLD